MASLKSLAFAGAKAYNQFGAEQRVRMLQDEQLRRVRLDDTEKAEKKRLTQAYFAATTPEAQQAAFTSLSAYLSPTEAAGIKDAIERPKRDRNVEERDMFLKGYQRGPSGMASAASAMPGEASMDHDAVTGGPAWVPTAEEQQRRDIDRDYKKAQTRSLNASATAQTPDSPPGDWTSLTLDQRLKLDRAWTTHKRENYYDELGPLGGVDDAFLEQARQKFEARMLQGGIPERDPGRGRPRRRTIADAGVETGAMMQGPTLAEANAPVRVPQLAEAAGAMPDSAGAAVPETATAAPSSFWTMPAPPTPEEMAEERRRREALPPAGLPTLPGDIAKSVGGAVRGFAENIDNHTAAKDALFRLRSLPPDKESYGLFLASAQEAANTWGVSLQKAKERLLQNPEVRQQLGLDY